MPVCKTCTSITSCTSCDTTKGFKINSTGICVCSSPTLLHPVTLSCLSCSTIISNCLTCTYSTSFDPATPSSVICTTPAPNYYILPNGTTAACG
jgi:hypothetical protein